MPGWRWITSLAALCDLVIAVVRLKNAVAELVPALASLPAVETHQLDGF